MSNRKTAQLHLRRHVESVLACDQRPAYWLTVNFNWPYSLRGCERKLSMWSYRLHRRLFRKHEYDEVPTSDLMLFYCSTEACASGNSHLHIVIFISRNEAQRFEACCEGIWRSLVPSSDTWLVPYQPQTAGSLAWYALKDVDRQGFHEAFTSSMALDIPTYGGRRRPRAQVARRIHLVRTSHVK